MNRKIFSLLLCLLTAFTGVRAQQSGYAGTFVNPSNTLSLRFKPMGNAYHGLLQTNGGNFAMKGSLQGKQLTGTIYTVNGPVPFTAAWQNNGLVLSAFGYTEGFYLYSREHELDQVDLTPYMNDQAGQGTASGQQKDFDHSYSQHSAGHASESYQEYPQGGATAQSPYPALKDQELFNIVAGSQVVYYTRTSYLNDNTASSITYVNFCRNGTFTLNYDGSFMVEGYYGDNAGGASYGQNSGKWQLVNYQGQPAVFMAYSNGNTSVNPIQKQLLLQGRWRIGNTQYAIQRNKVNCR